MGYPAIPEKMGDVSELTYAAVGRAMSEWERLEVELAHLYTKFVRLPRHSLIAIRPYGTPINFGNRMDGLENAAGGYFVTAPDQGVEGEFSTIATHCRKWSLRRNEVAHGIVQPVQWIRAFHAGDDDNIDMPDETKYCLLPPHYSPRRFDGANFPNFAYTSIELAKFEGEFYSVGMRVIRLVDALN